MEADNLTVCYQAIQRVYRNAVVGKIRDTLTQTFSGSAVDELKKPFKKEWDDIAAAANERRQTGELNSPLIDEFDLLGVNHFFSLFELHFSILCPVHAAKPPKELSQARQALLGWMKTIKNFRDPLSHPAEVDFDDDDARNMLYCARKVLDSLQLPVAAQQVLTLQRKLDSNGKLGVSLTYLPPADEVVTHFVGREHETHQLQRWLADPYGSRWALAGDGGKGKSAIAYNFAREVAVEGATGIEAVIWLSAKVRRFVQGNTLTVARPDFTDSDTAAAAIIEAYGFVPAPTSDPAQRQEQAMELLREFPALLVIDDIDTLEGLALSAIQFLVMDVPARTSSRVLVTSRRILFGLDSCTTAVSGMSETDANAFIASRCTLMGINANEVMKHAAAIREVTDSSPLYIEDLLRLTLAGVGIPQAIGLWREKRGAAAREYAIRREFEQLPNDAKEVLFTLSLMDRPCTLDELRMALDWHVDRLLDAQQSLRQMFLMPNVSQKDGTAKLALNSNTKLLVNSVFETSTGYARTKRTVQAVLGKLETNYQEEATVERTLRNVRAFVGRADRHSEAGRTTFANAEQTLKALNTRFPARADVYGTLGWVFKRDGRVTDARDAFRRAVELGCDDPEVFWHWSELAAIAHEWDEALQVAEKGRSTFPSNVDMLYSLGYAQTRAGREMIRGGQPEKGRELCQKAEKNLLAFIEAAGITTQRLAKAWRALVLNADALEDGKVVNRYLIEWRRACGIDDHWDTEYDRMRIRHPEYVQRRDEMPLLRPDKPI